MFIYLRIHVFVSENQHFAGMFSTVFEKTEKSLIKN